ncbi:hypothetical protein L9F63_025810 [Diploptera punctata]|uniref:CWF19-like protein 2 n=1 Tax=Diploptera punctata TaxID=6984 RepID=A0AAD7Z7E3_DIPPU|nr:hypothetical protein L9F63_025810 [Diploptera punctata]
MDRVLSNCKWCFDSKEMLKHLIVAIGSKLDEDVWNEVQTFKKTLVKLFKDRDEDVELFETATYLKKFPHMLIECVPMDKEVECATNKKLVDLKNKDVRRAVPNGLPFFTVDFGLDPGFAHVIEDERIFPRNFAQEIICGMFDQDHSIWRNNGRIILMHRGRK